MFRPAVFPSGKRSTVAMSAAPTMRSTCAAISAFGGGAASNEASANASARVRALKPGPTHGPPKIARICLNTLPACLIYRLSACGDATGDAFVIQRQTLYNDVEAIDQTVFYCQSKESGYAWSIKILPGRLFRHPHVCLRWREWLFCLDAAAYRQLRSTGRCGKNGV
jgi:hypothetical protein